MKRFLFLFGTVLAICTALLLGGCNEAECAHNRTAESVTLPTCDKEGFTLHQCPDCHFTYKTDVTPPTGHTLSATVTPPTCDKEGFTTYTCPCGYTFVSDILPPAGHQNESLVVAPTCSAQGYTKLTCTVCGHTYDTDYVNSLNHAFVQTAVAPTCTEAGYTEMTCSACDLSYQINFTDAPGHSFADETVDATCTEVGYTVRSCEACQFSYRSNYIDPVGHSFAKTIAHPTRTSAGEFVHTCNCGYVKRDPLFYSDVFTGAYEENTAILAKGVDVSLYQHDRNGSTYLPLNWQAVRAAGFEFAILKAGSTPRDTLGGLEPTFEMNYTDAKAAGMELGAYFYTYAATPEAIRADAELLLTWLDGKQFEYPIYFDLEDPSLEALSKDALTELCVTFISALQENGYYAALYSNNDWLVNRLHGDTLKAVYDIWYARPPLLGTDPVAADTAFSWNADRYGAQLGMWQYTHHGVIDGVEGKEFDFNYAYRDYPSIIKKYGYNGFSVE